MFQETEIDFPQERPGLAIFRLTRRLGERDALNILTRIRELKKQAYQTFVLDLRHTKGVTGAGLGAISFLAHAGHNPLPLLGQQKDFGKLFNLAKLEQKVILAPSEEALWPLLQNKAK